MDNLSPQPVRDLERIQVELIGKVEPSSIPPYVTQLPDERSTEACTHFLRYVDASGATSTVKSYAGVLLRYFRFLAAIDVRWDEATVTDVTDFFAWMKHAKKTNGNQNQKKRDSRVGRNVETGKNYVGESYSKSTMDHAETVLFGFYGHAVRTGQILYNPVIRGRAEDPRRGAHRSPLQPRLRSKQASNRQRRSKKRVPRSMQDDQYDAFFDALRSTRDRALAATYVSSGARPSEVVNLLNGDINLPDALITVTRKGGALQRLPISADAVIWIRLYQQDSGPLDPLAPAWRMERGEPRAFNYEALRAMFRRANQKLGTNWTPHDLRHTAATRMIADGVDPRVVQEVLGHASITTLEVYTTPRLEDQVAAVNRRGRARSGPLREPQVLTYDRADMAELFGSQDDE